MQRRFIRLRWDYDVSPSAWCQREDYERQADQTMFCHVMQDLSTWKFVALLMRLLRFNLGFYRDREHADAHEVSPLSHLSDTATSYSSIRVLVTGNFVSCPRPKDGRMDLAGHAPIYSRPWTL